MKPRSLEAFSRLNHARSLVIIIANLSLLSPFPATAQDRSGGPQSPVLRWMITSFPAGDARGIFSDALDKDWLSSSGTEALSRPSAIQDFNGPVWEETETGTDSLGLEKILDGTSAQIAYAYRSLNSQSDKEVFLRMESRGGVKLWINGDLVLADREHPSEQRALIARIRLARGINHILIKSERRSPFWPLSIRLLSTEESALENSLRKPEFLSVLLDEKNVSAGGPLRGLLTGFSPSGLLAPVNIVARDLRGIKLGAISKRLYNRFEVPLPPQFTGICVLAVERTGIDPGPVPAGELAIVGEPRAYVTGRIAAAFCAASSPIFGGRDPGRAASLRFHAKRLSGTTERSLESIDRCLRSCAQINLLLDEMYSRSPLSTQKPIESAPGEARQYARPSPLDGSLQPWSIQLPASYNPERTYGLILCLRSNDEDEFEAVQKLSPAKPADFIIAAPYGRGSWGFSSFGEADVLELLDTIQKSFPVDPARIFLSGWQEGAQGALRLAQCYPGRFAAVASFSGRTGSEFLSSLSNTPLLIVHGELDRATPLSLWMNPFKRLEEAPSPREVYIIPRGGRDAWEYWSAREGPERLLAYFRKFKGDLWPRQVEIRSPRPRYGGNAWASVLEHAKPGESAALSATVVDGRHARIDTENASLIRLDLRHPALAQTGRIVLRVNEVDIAVDSAQEKILLALSAKTGRFEVKKEGSGLEEFPGGGGIADLFLKPLTIIYGTRISGRTANLKNIAEAICAWPHDPKNGFRHLGACRIMSDKEASYSLPMGSSLILVGNPDENSISARYANAVPIQIGRAGITLEKRLYPKAGFFVMVPSRETPGAIVGVVSLPQAPDAGKAALAALLGSLERLPESGESAYDYGSPDSIIFNEQGIIMDSKSWDASWTILRLRP